MEPETLFINRFNELVNNGNFTLEDIGYAIGIKSKGTISKYLSGDITNIKRSQIIKLASLFSVSPAWLAGFSNDKYEGTTNSFSNELQHRYGERSINLLNNYSKLNDLGKQKVEETAEECTAFPKYTEKKGIYEANG